jgi:hypothetical protein
LFDTFDFFPEKDLVNEKKMVKAMVAKHNAGCFVDKEERTRKKLGFRENVIFRKGYIPDTFEELPEETYVFVSLDTDLYPSITAGLDYFSPRMSKGGVIAVHDYAKHYKGVCKAVREFAGKSAKGFIPIGDGSTVLFVF